jgi:hypothetical protein
MVLDVAEREEIQFVTNLASRACLQERINRTVPSRFFSKPTMHPTAGHHPGIPAG